MKVKLVDRRFKCHGSMKWLIEPDGYIEYSKICKVCESVFGVGAFMDNRSRNSKLSERWGYYWSDMRVVIKDDKDLLRIKLTV